MNGLNRLLTVCAALLLIVPAASANWSDDFDSYTLGSGLHGQGGWAGWENDPAWDAFVTDDQAQSTPHSLEAIPTTDIVQQFSETGGEWEMTAWCYIPSGSTGDQHFIMLNTYDPPSFNWSVQLDFLSDAGVVNEHYSSSTTPLINDQWVEVKVEIYLDSNSYDIYYNNNFLASNNWGATNAIAALDLFSDGGSTIYWDDLNLVNTGGALEQTTWGHIKTAI